MTGAFSWQNSVSLCPALFCTLGPNLPVTPGISLFPTFAFRASLVAQLVKNPPAIWRPAFAPWVGKIPWRRAWQPTLVLWPGLFHGLFSPWGCRVRHD